LDGQFSAGVNKGWSEECGIQWFIARLLSRTGRIDARLLDSASIGD
jgi:hypothetical protein